MRPAIKLAIFLATCATALAGAPETPTKPPISLVISVPQTTAKTGQDLKIEVTITNISSHDLLYPAYGNEIPFFLEVLDESKNEVQKSERGLRAYGGDGSVFSLPLHPGESLHRERFLNKDFRLDKPGNYTVQAMQLVSRTTKVKSNTVGFRITY